jgi:hypothetical protein
MAKPQNRGVRKLSVEETPTGFPSHDDAIIKECVAQFRSALVANYATIREFGEQSDNGKVSFGFRTTINRAGKRPVVNGNMSFGRRVSDSTEGVVEDPNQTPLPLSEDNGGES